ALLWLLARGAASGILPLLCWRISTCSSFRLMMAQLHLFSQHAARQVAGQQPASCLRLLSGPKTEVTEK
ncbi:unnamed protein product, partial [Symbiodinium necroappetens]